jgi:2-polyprenyl-6-methoxyphenol hydroxylase-like FAD-dependent oxidoreductase
LALAARGYPSAVFEQRRRHDGIDRGDLLHGAVLPLLRDWGVDLEPFRPHRFTTFRIVDGSERKLFEIDLAELLGGTYCFTTLKHPQITAALEAAAQATGLVEISRGDRCHELIEHRGRILGVRTLSGEYRAPLTVLATGARSKLRDTFGAPRHYHDYGVAVYNACVREISRFRDCAYYVFGRRGIIVLVPLPGGQLRVGLQFAPRRQPRPTAEQFAAMATAVLPSLDGEDLSVLSAHTYRLGYSLARRWWQPGLVVLGDAAHLVHPIGGQGMNLAFHDAAALAASLPSSAASASDWDAAAAGYASTRHRAVRRIARRINFAGRAGGVEHPALRWGRTSLVRAFDHTQPLKRATFQRLANVR